MTQDLLQHTFAVIAERVAPGATLARHWRLTGGVSAQVHALELALPDHELRRVVVRQLDSQSWKESAETVTTTEFQVLTRLHGAGLPVPEPLLLDSSCGLLPSPFLVMSFVEGCTAVTESALPTALPKMADFLTELHCVDLESGGLESSDLQSLNLSSIPHREDPVQGALEYLPTEYRSSHLPDAIRRHDLQPNPDCLLHGDYWPGNILWIGTEIAAVVDWEDVAIGCPLSDLACSRAELATMFGTAAAERFTQCYLRSSPLEVSDLPLWDFYVGAAALATMHEWGLPADVEKTRRERTNAFVELAARKLLFPQ